MLPGPRGAGVQLFVDADIDYAEFRRAVSGVPGLYRLDQSDEDGGEIEDASPASVSIGIIINHGDGWASHYANLQALVAIRTNLYRPRGQYVRAGDAIGYVGAPEADAFKCLHFELWERDRERVFVPVDPHPHLAGWMLRDRHDACMPAATVARTEAA